MSGVDRISAVFAQAKAENRAAFMPYHAMGYPNRETGVAVVAALSESGADLFEIGIPHSDPLADGPTIQASYTRALDKGIRLAEILGTVKALSPELTMPVVTMVSHATRLYLS